MAESPSENGNLRNASKGVDATKKQPANQKDTKTHEQIRKLVDISEIIEKNGIKHLVIEKDELLRLLASLSATKNAIKTGRTATGFEYVRSLAIDGHTQWEHTKVMVMFLRLLKFVHGAYQLPAQAALWLDSGTVRGAGDERHGLGFSVTLPRYGYAWFLDKVNWREFTFQVEFTDQILFTTTRATQSIRVRYQDVRAAQSGFVFAASVQRLLQMHPGSGVVVERLGQYLIGLCLQQYRQDVFSLLKSELKSESVANALAGRKGKGKNLNGITYVRNRPRIPDTRCIRPKIERRR